MRSEICHTRALTVTPIGAEKFSIRPARAEGRHDPAKTPQNPFHAWPLFLAAAAKCLSLVAFTSILAPIILASMSASTTLAQEKKGGGDLGTQATNPAAALIQLQLQDQFVPSTHNADGVANSAIIQPVYPFVLDKDYYFSSIITRTTIPIVTTPDLPILGRTTGLGDTTLLVVPVHKTTIGVEGGFFQWGPIGATTIPSATNDETGSGKLSLGPGLLGFRNYTKVFNDGDSLLIGGFGYQQWSVAGEGDRQDVSKFFSAAVVVYHFKSLFGEKAWYAGLVQRRRSRGGVHDKTQYHISFPEIMWWCQNVGQLGGEVKVYSGVWSCRQNPVYHVLLPTRTSDRFGSRTLALGPTAVGSTTPGHRVIGALASNVWFVAGDDDAPDVAGPRRRVLGAIRWAANKREGDASCTSEPTITGLGAGQATA